jgi:hypothetical protein
MLSFEVIEQGSVIQIYCDQEGLQILKNRLEDAARLGHVHIRSLRSGGNDLNLETPWGKPAIGEVIITTGSD